VSNATLKDLSVFPPDWPNIEYIVVDAYFGKYTDLADPGDGYNYATVLIGNVSPLSRGNISITSKDTKDPPVINLAWFTHPADVEVLVAGFKRARQILRPHLNEILIGEEYWPGANVTTDAEIKKIIAESIAPIYHPAGTCAMGKGGDPNAVVDTKARVFGVRGLRVVDASAFPILPPGHPMGTVYALSEKIADDILKG
jgi:choline dehydrogenase